MPGEYEFPGLQLPAATVWSVAHAVRQRAADATATAGAGGADVLDLAMRFGSSLHGHLAVRDVLDVVASTDRVAAPGLGDLHSHALREQATRGLCEWAAPHWGGAPAADELRAVVLHTGSEAVETALKTALLATGRSRIVAFEGSYHGTFGLALAVTHGERFRAPFARQFGATVEFAPYGVVPTLDDTVACVIVEPIQGRSGVIAPPEGFLEQLRSECSRTGTLLVLDDVLVACGRTTDPLPGAHVAPDLVCLGKALGSGVAASAAIASRDVAEAAWGSVDGEAIHTSTWLADPISCAGVLHTLSSLEPEEIASAAVAWREALTRASEDARLDLRGEGLLWALDTGASGGGVELAATLLERGILVVPSGSDGSSITLYPSLAHGAEHRQQFVQSLITLRAR